MTSEEALESWFNVISTNDKIRWEEHYKVIKKDLEVLKILKDHLVTDDKYIMICIHKDNKDFNKVKELLENEK